MQCPRVLKGLNRKSEIKMSWAPCLGPLFTNITTATQQQGHSLEKEPFKYSHYVYHLL